MSAQFGAALLGLAMVSMATTPPTGVPVQRVDSVRLAAYSGQGSDIGADESGWSWLLGGGAKPEPANNGRGLDGYPATVGPAHSLDELRARSSASAPASSAPASSASSAPGLVSQVSSSVGGLLAALFDGLGASFVIFG